MPWSAASACLDPLSVIPLCQLHPTSHPIVTAGAEMHSIYQYMLGAGSRATSPDLAVHLPFIPKAQ